VAETTDDRWLSPGDIVNEICARAPLSRNEVDGLVRAGVERDVLKTSDGKCWSEIKESYGDHALRRTRQQIGNRGARYNPTSRWSGESEREPRQSLAELSTAMDNFMSDPAARLNLQKTIAFISQHHGVSFAPVPAPDVIDMDAASAPGPGRKADEIWRQVEDDLLLWLDRNHPDIEKPDYAQLNRWMEKWLLDREFEKPKGGHKPQRSVPAESTIKLHGKAVWDRYAASLRRQKEKPTIPD
jgi:hypothetical protein